MTIIDQLFSGALDLREFPDSPDAKPDVQRMIEFEKALLQKISPDEKKLFEQYQSEESAVHCYRLRDALELGFRTGVRVALELSLIHI